MRIDFNEHIAMRSPIPFYHSDVSALAKSIRGALLSANIDSLKHIDFLNLLARSKGFSNFQEFKECEFSATTEHMIVLKAVPSSLSELSEQVHQGKTIDRRKQPVEALLFRLNVSILLTNRSADFVIHARATGNNWFFGPDYVPSEKRVWHESISKLARLIQNDQLRPFSRNRVNILLPKVGAADEVFDTGSMQDIVLNAARFSKVERVVDQIEQATTQCQSVFDWLMSTARSPYDVQQHQAEVSQSLEYIDAVARVSGDSYLHGWSVEKMANFRYYLTLWSSGKGLDNHADEFKNLFPFKAPTAWVGTPPALGELLLDLIETNRNRSTSL